MKKHRRMVALIAALALVAGILSGCSNASNDNGMGGEVLFTIDKEEIKSDEYEYYFANGRAYFEQNAGGSAIWDAQPTLVEQLKTSSVSMIKQDRAVRKLAEDCGITLDDADNQAIEANIEQLKSSFASQEEFDAYLKENHLTLPVMRHILTTNRIKTKLTDAWFGENGTYAVSDYAPYIEKAKEQYVHVKHILISSQEGDADAKKALAQQVLQKAKNGEDFDTLIQTYGEDPGMLMQPDGYYFTQTDSYDEDFKAASFALEENTISDLVETSFGWHIIQRLPIPEEQLQTLAEALAQSEYSAKANELLNEALDGMTVTYNDAYKAITIQSYPDVQPAESSSESTEPSSEAASSSEDTGSSAAEEDPASVPQSAASGS